MLEPKGFIRIIEFIIAIFAFATCCGYSGIGSFEVACKPPVVVEFKFGYPFRLTKDIKLPEDACIQGADWNKTVAIGSEGSSQFFVFIGVWSFLTCLATVALYVIFDELIQVLTWIPQVDFVHSAAIAFCWLVASSAWAQGLTDIKTQTNSEELMMLQGTCKTASCRVIRYVDYASLNVSVVSS